MKKKKNREKIEFVKSFEASNSRFKLLEIKFLKQKRTKKKKYIFVFFVPQLARVTKLRTYLNILLFVIISFRTLNRICILEEK